MSLQTYAFKTASVIGLGYIGLPVAALLASRGIRVMGVDTNKKIVETISEGQVHIVEPDLDGLVQKVVSNGNLTAETKVYPADVFIITVPTPLTARREPDVSYVERAASSIAQVIEPGNLIIIESTVPVGTTERIAAMLQNLRKDLNFPVGDSGEADINIAYCPERVLPGRILTELVQNDRCIGGLTPGCARRACALYDIFLQGRCYESNARMAELVKLTENAYRDVNIAFANELSIICDHVDINVWDMIPLANLHPRVNILQPGPGVGGHCISVDPWFIVDAAPKKARLIRTAREINENKPHYVLGKAKEALSHNNAGSIACLGLTFKPNVNDMRNSPSLDIVRKLAGQYGDRVIVVEPFISKPPACLVKAGARFMDALSAVDESSIILLLVDHRQFGMIDAKQLKKKTIIDTRGLWKH